MNIICSWVLDKIRTFQIILINLEIEVYRNKSKQIPVLSFGLARLYNTKWKTQFAISRSQKHIV